MQKVDFLMTRVYVVFPFFWQNKYIYSQSAKKQKTKKNQLAQINK